MNIQEARMYLYNHMLFKMPSAADALTNFYISYSHSWDEWKQFVEEGGLDELIIKTYKL